MSWKAELAIVAMAVGTLLCAGEPARAGSPKIGSIAPAGVQRGVASELSINGGNLAGNPRLIAPFGFRVEPLPPDRSNAGAWSFKITVAPETALGAYPVRVQTDDGLSNPFLLTVGQLPQVIEKEDNGSYAAAQALPSVPLVVEGQVAGNDVDYFRFAGKKGMKIVIDAQCARIGSGVDPSIRLTTAAPSRRFVASADDTPGLLTDARLFAELPEDGDYVLELSDSQYQGGKHPIYRLVIGPVPVAEEVYPLGGRAGETIGLELRGGTLPDPQIAATALRPAPGFHLHPPRITSLMMGVASFGTPGLDVESLTPLAVDTLPELREPVDGSAPSLRAAPPIVLNGRIDPAGDEDRFVLTAAPGQRFHVAVQASEYGSSLDGVLQVLNAKGSQIARADDTAIPGTQKQGGQDGLLLPDPSLDVTVPAGTSEVTLALRDLEGRGGQGFPYRIVVTPLAATFELTLSEPQVSVPRGGHALVGVTVARKGYTGPIALTLADPPSGLSVRPGTIPGGQTTGALSLSAASDAAFAALPLRVVGRGEGTPPIEVEATSSLVFSKLENLPANVMVEHGLPAAPALPTPVTLETPPSPVEVVHGFGGTIPVRVARGAEADAALAITALPVPKGLTVPAAKIAEKAAEGSVAVQAAVEAPLGVMTIGLQAKGKFKGGEQVVALPAVTLDVVRPVELSLAAPSVELKPGASVEVKGTVRRKGPFQEPVTVKLDGLPGGLKADPVTIPPKESAFTLKLSADAKAAPGSPTAKVVPAYQVNKKDYPAPGSALTIKITPAK
jgi:hypothetical protein